MVMLCGRCLSRLGRNAIHRLYPIGDVSRVLIVYHGKPLLLFVNVSSHINAKAGWHSTIEPVTFLVATGKL
jgi:hypothetical protein